MSGSPGRDNNEQVMSPKRERDLYRIEQLKALRKFVVVPTLTKKVNFITWSELFLSTVKMQGIYIYFLGTETGSTSTASVDSEMKFDDEASANSEAMLKFSARAYLFSKLDDEIREIISPYDDGMTPGPMWQALQTHFRGTSDVEMAQLLEQLYSLKQDEGMSLTKYIDKLTYICKRLSGGKSAVREMEKKVIFMRGLHERYSVYKDILREQENNS